jgi:hypothetical protein
MFWEICLQLFIMKTETNHPITTVQALHTFSLFFSPVQPACIHGSQSENKTFISSYLIKYVSN